jgi:sec-independent protein translocase protein TatA
MDIGIPELLIILVIVLLIFGAGRVAQAGSELGKAIRGFREGLRGDGENATPGRESAAGSEAEEETANPDRA